MKKYRVREESIIDCTRYGMAGMAVGMFLGFVIFL